MQLVACPACRRQYDVTHHPENERVRCLCGEVFPVVFHEPHEARALRCSSCGGTLEDGARACKFCESEFTLLERRLDSVCPACYARLASDARFCMECGVEIAPQALVAVPESAACPRCQGELRSRDLGTTSLVECSACAGLWCTPDTFKRICSDAVRGASAPIKDSAVTPTSHDFKYLKCPSCSDMMVPRSFGRGSGIMIDVCGRHGVWLDDSELGRIVNWVAENGVPSNHGVGRKPKHEPNPRALQSLTAGRRSDSWTIGTFLESVAEFFMTDMFD